LYTLQKKSKNQPKDINWDYYLDAMRNGPQLSGELSPLSFQRLIYYSLLSGHLPIPSNFTTVGKPHIFVNQYDSPIEVYSDETIEEMKEERLTMMNPDYQERKQSEKGSGQQPQPQGVPRGKVAIQEHPFAKMNSKQFDSNKSNVLGLIGK